MTTWATQGRAAALSAAVFLTLIAIGCSETPPPEPIDLVPADANLVANVELGRILADPDVASGFESMPRGGDAPASLEDALAQVQAETGIDLLQFSDIVAFGVVDTSMAPDDQSDFAIMARGTFDGDAILDKVRLGSGGELTRDEYRGHALLIGTEADGSESVMTVLADEVFVFGTRGAVTSVIDVLEDEEGALSGPLLDTYVALGDPLVKAAFAVPPGAVDDLGGLPTDAIPIPFDPSLLSDIEIAGFAGDKEADLVSIRVTLEYASAATAENASEYFGALLTLAGPFIPPGAAADLVDLIDISHVDATVTISLSATVDQLTTATEELGGAMQQRPGRIVDVGVSEETLPPSHGPPYIYNTRPPSSGSHSSRLSPYGLLAGAIVPEAAVHNMEHGAVVIWYQPGDPDLATDVGRLVQQIGSQCLVAGSHADMDFRVGATVWGGLLGQKALDIEPLLEFVQAYRGNAGPEAGLCWSES